MVRIFSTSWEKEHSLHGSSLKSRPFVTSSTLNLKLYISECLQRRLLTIIRPHNVPVKFWPDSASYHYARDNLNWFETNAVDVSPKNISLPNCPQFRPIEQYWGIIKGKMKKTQSVIRDDIEILRKFNKCASEVSNILVQTMMGSIKGKVCEFLREN